MQHHNYLKHVAYVLYEKEIIQLWCMNQPRLLNQIIFCVSLHSGFQQNNFKNRSIAAKIKKDKETIYNNSTQETIASKTIQLHQMAHRFDHKQMQ